MAEERLIDDDKDRKYKIRINADGEEELVIDETKDEEEEAPVFAFPDYEFDDEEAAELTEEQLKERDRLKAEEKAARKEKLSRFLNKAKEKLSEGDFEGAKYAVTQAEEIDSTDGELCCIKLKILTRNMTEFLDLEQCADAADGVKEYAAKEQREEYLENSERLKTLYEETKTKTDALFEENESKKEERRATLKKARTNALIWLVCAVVPFIVFVSLAINFSFEIVAGDFDEYMILTIVFAALTLVSFILTVIAAKRFWTAAHDVKLNERDSSTKIGREYSEYKTRLDFLKRIYDLF